jgi:transposase
MGQRTYSSVLRSRVVAELAADMSRRKAARLYRLDVSSAIRWVGLLQDETGGISPRPRGGKSRSPLEPHADWLFPWHGFEVL